MTFFSSIKIRITNAVSKVLHKIYVFIDTSIRHYPQFYLALAVLAASVGYTYVLMFPVLVIMGPLNAYTALTSDAINWVSVSTWTVVTIIAALVSYRITQFKSVQPVGLTLSEDKAPELFKLILQARETFGRPEIHRIVITSDYELDIIKTPKWALPVYSSNTMIIGLPVLQCHAPEQLACMIARRIGQFSKNHNPITNWLYQLRAIWHMYYLTYTKNKAIGTELLRGFFYIFAPFYDFASVIAARLDELRADSYAMEIYNDEVVREMITADTIYRWYLENEYWPAIYKIGEISPKTKPTPHAKMTVSLRNKLNTEKIAALTEDMMKIECTSNVVVPPLTIRLENIGHETPRMSQPEGDTAAMFYLGNLMDGVIDLIDKLWLKTLHDKRKQ
jgi:hypothetical protein